MVVKPIAAYKADEFSPKFPVMIAKAVLNKKTMRYHFCESDPG
jgi:hypothetical protein